jgi:4-amino-4-deoxy-L-arabinose transferase-like glycosyltransferase
MVKQTLKKHWFLLVLILVFLLRLSSLFEPFTYGDEGVYLTLGQAVRKGLVLYRDIHDNKPPLIYLLAALARTFSVYRILFLVWSFLTVFVFFQFSQAFFKKNFWSVVVATTAFAFLSNLHTFEGNVANAENFMLLPTILGFFCLFRLPRDSKLTWLGAGFFLSLAVLFKVPAIFDFGALMVIAFFLFLEKKKKKFLDLLFNFLFLFAGLLIPITFSLLYYTSQNALSQYLKAAFFQNLPYLSSWSGSQVQAAGLPLPLLIRGLLVFLLVVYLYLIRKKISLVSQIILIWFAFTWFAALLSSRPYPHYLLQVLPSLSLALGFLFYESLKNKKEKIIPFLLLFVFLFTIYFFHFWGYKNLPYYTNFYQFALEKKSLTQYWSDYDERAQDFYQVATYLKSHTLPSEKIFIWGNDPFIYALTERLPVGRYTTTYHIIDFGQKEEILDQLQEQLPRYLVVDQEEKSPFTEFFLFVGKHYALEKQINDFLIYHRLF